MGTLVVSLDKVMRSKSRGTTFAMSAPGTNVRRFWHDQVMKDISLPMAIMISVAMIVIGIVAVMDRDIQAVGNVILMLLVALGIGELREIKGQTNGNMKRLLDELAEARRTQSRMTDRAFDSIPPPKEDA